MPWVSYGAAALFRTYAADFRGFLLLVAKQAQADTVAVATR
jgi:hypothetical protein